MNLALARVGWGSEPRVLPPLSSVASLPPRVPKTQMLLLYASLQSWRGLRTLSCDAQAAELVRVVALPCTREHHEINFRQKDTYGLKDSFSVFLPNGAKRLIFIMSYHLRYDRVFIISTPNCPDSTSGPRGASGIRLGHNLTQSGSNLSPIGDGTQLGPIYIHKLPISCPSGRYVIYEMQIYH